jgi:hypothetical protein
MGGVSPGQEEQRREGLRVTAARGREQHSVDSGSTGGLATVIARASGGRKTPACVRRGFNSARAAPVIAVQNFRCRRRIHEGGFRLVGGYVLKDGRRLGAVRLALITTAVTDAIYEKLSVITSIDANGNVIERERRTRVNHAMKTCHRAWNVAARRNPDKVPLINPFAKMGLRSSNRETPTATFAELQAFREMAVEMRLPSLASAAAATRN